MARGDRNVSIALTVTQWRIVFRILRQDLTPHPVDDSLLADKMEREMVDQLPDEDIRRYVPTGEWSPIPKRR